MAPPLGAAGAGTAGGSGTAGGAPGSGKAAAARCWDSNSRESGNAGEGAKY